LELDSGGGGKRLFGDGTDFRLAAKDFFGPEKVFSWF
jgi:hypothetical protein